MFYETLKAVSELKTPEEVVARFKQDFPALTVKCLSPCGCLMAVSRSMLKPLVIASSVKRVETICRYVWEIITRFKNTGFSRRTSARDIHNFLRGIDPEKWAVVINIVNDPVEERDALNEQSKRTTGEKNRETKNYRGMKVRGVMEHLAGGNDKTSLICYLLLATGRRMVELWISAFEHGNKKLSYPNLKFKNQAKTKDNLEEYKREWFIPVIGVSKNREEVEDLALEKLALLRKITAGEVQKLKDSDPPSINSSITWYYSKRVNRRLTNLLGPGTTAHTARKIYGAISVALYNRGSQVSDLAFLTDALAHRDFQSTSSYTNVRVI